ncbi:MAG TPA: glycosyltransferase family 39 protein, partial [Puia sp.]|nr:glycosyltransferase family 39 protein [Puia sp.]
MKAIAYDLPETSWFSQDRKIVVWLTLFIVFIRFLFIGFMGLMPQDGYYYFYASHPALSYYDHPPMIAYILLIFTSVLGKHVYVLKLADTCITALSVLAFYSLSKQFLPLSKARNGTILLLSTLMISILSLVSTPDVPLMLFWSLTLIFLHQAIFKHKKIAWIWAGLLTGLSFDSKYTAVFLIIGVVGFLLISNKSRRQLFSVWFLLYLLAFTIVIIPVLLWNAQHDFASFKFQSGNRVNEGLQFDPLGFAGVIGHQSAVLSPLLLGSLFYFLYRFLRKYGLKFNRIPADILFLLSFFVPLFLGFLFLSFFYWIKLNWIMPAYITGLIWICRYWNQKWTRTQLIFSLVLHLAMVVEVIFYPVPITSDDTWFGWKQLAGQVKSVKANYPDAFIFSTDDYKTSAVLNFYLSDTVYSKNIVGERALQFDYVGTDLEDL